MVHGGNSKEEPDMLRAQMEVRRRLGSRIFKDAEEFAKRTREGGMFAGGAAQ